MFSLGEMPYGFTKKTPEPESETFSLSYDDDVAAHVPRKGESGKGKIGPSGE